MLAALCAAAAFQGAPTMPAVPIWGVTIDNLANLDQIVPALAGFRKRTTARIVFDLSTGPEYYLSAMRTLAPIANLMGEPIDSAPPSGQLSVAAYVARMTQYMTTLGPLVSIWEIGNEVNGDWTCPSPEMAQKIEATLAQANLMHAKTALTLFYSPNLLGTDREMVTWSQTYLPASVRAGVDYVLVSYYPTSLAGGPNWPKIFRNLATTYPNALVGFGELGLSQPGGTLSNNCAAKARLIRQLYTAGSLCPGRFINGYFWWTFAEDAVPKGTGLWSTFNAVIH